MNRQAKMCPPRVAGKSVVRLATLLAAPFALGLSIAATAGPPASAGTVYCSVASKPAEFAICNSEDLQVLDGRVDELYKSQYATSASILSQTELTRDHRNWMSERNGCRSDLGCLERYYKQRLSKLAAQEKSAKEPIAQFTRFADQKAGR